MVGFGGVFNVHDLKEEADWENLKIHLEMCSSVGAM